MSVLYGTFTALSPSRESTVHEKQATRGCSRPGDTLTREKTKGTSHARFVDFGVMTKDAISGAIVMLTEAIDNDGKWRTPGNSLYRSQEYRGDKVTTPINGEFVNHRKPSGIFAYVITIYREHKRERKGCWNKQVMEWTA